MGGSSYDRDEYSDSSSSGWGRYGSSAGGYRTTSTSSGYAKYKMSSSELDDSMLPNGKVLKSEAKVPIIVVLDVTGSNIEFARIVYDKMPMFYGQIEQRGYLEDFEISVCAVGDAYSDQYPLQIGNFAKGIELDSWLEKLVLEANGGYGIKESYELAAYYLYQNTRFSAGSEPIIIFIGDEIPYDTVDEDQARDFEIECPHADIEPFALLRKKVNENVFMLLNKYQGKYFNSDITKCWEKLLAADHVIKINEEKAVVDLMLGIISMVSSSRSLDEYAQDMKDRGQTESRIYGVTESLKDFSETVALIKVEGTITTTDATKKTTSRGTRL